MDVYQSLAENWGVTVESEEQPAFDEILSGMDEAIQSIRAESQPKFEHLHDSPDRHDGRKDHWSPGTDSDQYNAWLQRCSIEGATDGHLSDLTAGIKDNIAVAGIPCTAGSSVLSFIPEIDATVVGRLLDAGVTILGKQNMDAFAMGDAGEIQDFGKTWNPHDQSRLAGGSSSGSAAAVAAGDCDLSLGTDQAGSVRNPAAWCGVVGCKPTYGLVPYTGIFGMDFGFDHVGIFTRDIKTNTRVLTAIAGEDRQNGCRLDPRQSHHRDSKHYTDNLDIGSGDLTIGVLTEGFGWPTADPAVESTVRDQLATLENAGVSLKTVSAPTHSVAASIIGIVGALGAHNTYSRGGVGTTAAGWHWKAGEEAFKDGLKHRADDLSPAVIASLLFAERCRLNGNKSIYGQAKNIALKLDREYQDCLKKCDVLAMPTVPFTALSPADDQVTQVTRLAKIPVNTAGCNQTGHPALSVPCGTVDGLPVGLQLIGSKFEEATLYRVGQSLEKHSPPIK
jgi:Asp-tRNAAsn/Glu-tRNAGln amidotransferase A subunit and related amidases